MPPSSKRSIVSIVLRRWYWLLATLLPLAVWAGLALALYPRPDSDGNYASRPYGLSTNLENKAVDLLFQLRDVRRPDLRRRGLTEPITIIKIDDQAIAAANVRLQKW